MSNEIPMSWKREVIRARCTALKSRYEVIDCVLPTLNAEAGGVSVVNAIPDTAFRARRPTTGFEGRLFSLCYRSTHEVNFPHGWVVPLDDFAHQRVLFQRQSILLCRRP